MSHRQRKLIIFLVLFVGIPALSFLTSRYGYCQSWWGKDNLLFRAWWLCECPDGFEQTLYPPYIEVMFSTCSGTSTSELVDHRYLLVRNDKQFPTPHGYFLDLVTEEKQTFQPPAFTNRYIPLTKDWLLLRPEKEDGVWEPYHLYQWTTEKKIPLTEFPKEELTAHLTEDLHHPSLISFLQNQEKIIVFDRFSGVVALAPDWEQNQANSLIFIENSIVEEDIPGDWLSQLIRASGVDYIEIISGHLGLRDKVSPNSQWVARPLAIYDAVTDELVLPVPLLDYPSTRLFYCRTNNLNNCDPDFRPCCWSPDSQSIIYRFTTGGHTFPPLHRVQIGSPRGTDAFGDFWMPVLRVHLPQE